MLEPSVKMIGIKKKFPGVQALGGVDLTIYPGEVHALLGENGAGKSVLLKILLGAIHRDEGEIYLDGKLADIDNPIKARDLGISAVYQDLKLAMPLSVAENISLGRLPGKYGFVNKNAMKENASKYLKDLKLDIDVNADVDSLSVARKQMVAIAKALSCNVRVLLLDEPTAMLTNEETKTLFDTVRSLKENGVSIVYVSHRLEEIFELCDRVTILRDGQNVGSFFVRDISRSEMVTRMAGREIKDVYQNATDKTSSENGQKILECHNLTCNGKFQDVSFSVKEGEIVGFYGLVGAGRTEVMRAIFGADKYDSGQVKINGKPVKNNKIDAAVKAGVALVPEDRHKQGVALNLSVKSNINIINYNAVSKFGVVSPKEEREVTRKYIDLLNIKTPSQEQEVQNLSGGNQQKVAIAKWLNKNQEVLIFDEPTIGIDVATKYEIYDLLSNLAKNGAAIIFVSSYMPELLGVCDRILVMCNGRITGELPKEEFNEGKILEYAFQTE